MSDEMNPPPMPQEIERVVDLSEYGLNYNLLQDELVGFTRIAAEIVGAKVSMVNLVDYFTQWTVAKTGTDIVSMPREDSVCQYTILRDEPLELKDFSQDTRTCDKSYACGPGALKYYYGVPLKTAGGRKLGALCILDTETHQLNEQQVRLMNLLADEVMGRLEKIREINLYRAELYELRSDQRKLGHDVRSPLSGVVSLSQMVVDQLNEAERGDIAELVQMIHDSSQSVIDLAEGILDQVVESPLEKGRAHRVKRLGSSIRELFGAQAKAKQVQLKVEVSHENEKLPVPHYRLLQVCANLTSNALKFTPTGGSVTVSMGYVSQREGKQFQIKVTDTGPGVSPEILAKIAESSTASTLGSAGEKGRGMGILLIKELVNQMRGSFTMESPDTGGCRVVVHVPA